MPNNIQQVEFSPNEPGVPFGDNLAHQVSRICHQICDSKTPALPPIRLFPVINPANCFEVTEIGGELINMSLGKF